MSKNQTVSLKSHITLGPLRLIIGQSPECGHIAEMLVAGTATTGLLCLPMPPRCASSAVQNHTAHTKLTDKLTGAMANFRSMDSA